MILMYDKETLEGRWFRDTEIDVPDDTTGYTEKQPTSGKHLWDDGLNEWVLPENPENDTDEWSINYG